MIRPAPTRDASRRAPRGRPAFQPSLAAVLAALFLVVLWIAGGATRGDTLGQAAVRGAAWAVLVACALFVRRPTLDRGWQAPALLLMLAWLLVMLQLVPLPPGVWQALPGRAMLAGAARVAGEAQPWRPLSIVPDLTTNSAASLVVPAAMLVLAACMRAGERVWLLRLLLCLVVASALLGLLQFSGSRFNNPLINDQVGQISASFANRNHLALFLAIGIAAAPAWVFCRSRQAGWHAPAALGMVLLFTLMILATGSRAGLLLGSLALLAGPAAVWRDLRKFAGRLPARLRPALAGATVMVVAGAILAAVVANRASSINRVFAGDEGEDMRTRALPTVLHAIGTYFPAGSGLGGFDPVFRIHEPMSLLKLTYFNHAHDDFLELALDGGALGLLLLVAGIGWWLVASVRAWRGGSEHNLARLGSTILGLVLVASAFDYPARTPMIMAVVVVAAIWLDACRKAPATSALRARSEHL